MNHSDLLFYQVLLASVAAIALLLTLDYLIHRRKEDALPVGHREDKPGKVDVIVPAPKPEPLPRLEPLAFTAALRRSLKDYSANLILVVPGLVEFGWSEVRFLIASTYLKSSLNVASFLVGILVTFLVFLGQISMTGVAIAEGKTTLRDWPGCLKNLWTLFGLVLVFGLLLAGPYFGSSLLYEHFKPLGTAIASAFYFLLIEPILILGQSVLLVCFAAVALDNKNFAGSLRMAWHVMSSRRSAFAGLVIFSLLVSIALDVPVRLIAPILVSVPPQLMTLKEFLDYGFGLIRIVLTPLWYLIAFRIYRGFNENRDIHTLLQPNTEELRIATARRQFCTECGAELPTGSKFCIKCGSKQS